MEDKDKTKEEYFRLLADNVSDMIYRMSLPDGYYEYVSSASTAIFGYSPEEFYNTPLLVRNVIHPDWRDYFEEKWAKLCSGDMPQTYEYQIIHKSGETRWMNQRNVLIRDNSGRPVAIEGIVTDITERKKTEEALQKTTEILEKIFSNTHLMIAYLDKNFNFVRVNRTYADADDRVPEFFEGKNHFDLYPNEENKAIFQNVVETGEPYFAYAKPFKYAEHPERGVTYWDWSLLPVKGEDGKVKELILCIINVTERKKAEKEIEKKMKELEKFYEMAVGRELRMKELKGQIKKLEAELAKYKKDRG